jgi:hypothetical protein
MENFDFDYFWDLILKENYMQNLEPNPFKTRSNFIFIIQLFFFNNNFVQLVHTI